MRQQLRYDTGVPARCSEVQCAPACFGQTQLQGVDRNQHAEVQVPEQRVKSCISHRHALAHTKATVFADTYQAV